MDAWEVSAREAVRHTIASYTYAADNGRFDDVAQLFAPDGVLEVQGVGGAVAEGRDAILQFFRGVGGDVTITAPPGRMQHHVSSVRVAMGLDVADGYLARSAKAGDLAITADIPLAAALVARGAVVLDLRGTVYTEENVGEALGLRNFHHELREGGVMTGGPSGFGPKQAREFAGAFDRELSKAMRSTRPTNPGGPAA